MNHHHLSVQPQRRGRQNVADFNFLIARTAPVQTSAFALTETDIRRVGRMFGQAEDATIANRGATRQCLNSLRHG